MLEYQEIIVALITAILGGVFGLFLASFKVRKEIEKELQKENRGLLNEQRQKFFLPFKYYALEFNSRAKHVLRRLSFDKKDLEKAATSEGDNGDSLKLAIAKNINMIKRLYNMREKLENKHDDLEWFFNDSVGPNGGYFINSTLYQTCLLFYWMKRILQDFPFIPIEISNEEGIQNKLRAQFQDLEKIEKLEAFLQDNELAIFNLIREIRVAISGNNGVPYALQDSFGSYISNGDAILDYEVFCKKIMEQKESIKFFPIFRYWGDIVNGELDFDEIEQLGGIKENGSLKKEHIANVQVDLKNDKISATANPPEGTSYQIEFDLQEVNARILMTKVSVNFKDKSIKDFKISINKNKLEILQVMTTYLGLLEKVSVRKT